MDAHSLRRFGCHPPVPVQIWVLSPGPGEWMLPSRSHAPSPAPLPVWSSRTSDQGWDLRCVFLQVAPYRDCFCFVSEPVAYRSRDLQKIRPSSWWSACPLTALKTRCLKATGHRPISYSHTFVSGSGHLFLAQSVMISQLRTQWPSAVGEREETSQE